LRTPNVRKPYQEIIIRDLSRDPKALVLRTSKLQVFPFFYGWNGVKYRSNHERRKGKPHQSSDVDLLVVMETNERPLSKQIEIARALSPHPFGMDILVRTPEQLRERIALGDSFLREITTRGKLLYERPSR
jgi:hypothetical protein